MSVYTNFFIRYGDAFIPIATHNRGSAISRIFNENTSCPWERVTNLTEFTITSLINSVMEEKRNWEDRIKSFEKKINLVKNMDSSLAERLDIISDYEDTIEEIHKELSELDYAHSFLCFLSGMIEELKYRDDDDDDEYAGSFTNDSDHYIYFGCEIGYPTVKDIVD